MLPIFSVDQRIYGHDGLLLQLHLQAHHVDVTELFVSVRVICLAFDVFLVGF